MSNDNDTYVTLRGIGKYYGHVIKVKVIRLIPEENCIEVATSEGSLKFDTSSGFQAGIGKEIGYSSYQLDIDTIHSKHMPHRLYINKLREV